MTNLPLYISILFAAVTLATLFIFYKATNNSRVVLVISILLLAIQSVPALMGFYLKTDTIPPRFILLIGPPVLTILFLFLTKRGRKFIDSMNLKTLTILHTIRLPIEIILHLIFVFKYIPELITYKGKNLDILSGITAPIIYYFLFVLKKDGLVQQRSTKYALIIWNLSCLALLINVVTLAILSAPFPFQKYAFDQPTIAVLHFPFVWLPCFIVPVVLLAHLSAIRVLWLSLRNTNHEVRKTD